MMSSEIAGHRFEQRRPRLGVQWTAKLDREHHLRWVKQLN